ncbi:MAG: hypothetical protein KGM99_04200 [Burkholderiales bacterium]|nr:hypothetical protein [Burkholderiales bacterium]
MKILSSDVAMASSHAATSQSETNSSIRAWIGNQRPNFEGVTPTLAPSAPVAATGSSKVQISDAGKLAQAAQSSEASAVQQSSDEVISDPMLMMLKNLVEIMTGKKIHLLNAADLQSSSTTPEVGGGASSAPPAASAPAKAGFGVEIDTHQSYTETEQTSFSASGTIITADNKKINFQMSLQMQRSYHEENSSSVRLGDAKKVDPLVLNFAGNAAQLTDRKFSFDLNGDGTKENISFVQGGGFLALDKNGDGKINNGTELFGPGSGNGFADLAQYDSDGNHWIDENDAIYQQLKIWTKDSAGNDQLSSLKQMNVGALYLGSSSTQFDLNTAQNQNLGQVRSSGVWLSEDGKAHALQQVDLSV